MKNKKKKHLSSYDKSILFSVKLSNWILLIYILLNLFCPTYTDGSLGRTGIFSYLSIIFAIIGTMGVHGYFNQYVPMLPLILVRVAQFVICDLARKMMAVNLISFIILCLVDVGCCIFWLTDRANYEYVKVKEE